MSTFSINSNDNQFIIKYRIFGFIRNSISNKERRGIYECHNS